jgi:PiT family inorganic phosphate transporter
MLDLIVILAILIAAYMAWNIGANDVANAMGTSVGSGALTLRRAIIVAAVFEFLGAVLFGSHVTDTIRKGVLDFGDDETLAEYSEQLMYGFMAALLAAAIWLTVATKWGLPVSTTHSIVGGVIGMGLFIRPSAVNWDKVLEIVLSWVASPLLGGILAFLSFWVIKKVIMEHDDPVEKTRKVAPILALPTFFVLGLALQFKALKGFYNNLDSSGHINKENWLPAEKGTSFNPLVEGAWIPVNSFLVALAIGVIASSIMYLFLRRYEFKEEGYAGVERVFIWLQIITACYVAFAHGANDVANAIGPMAAIYQIATSGTLTASAEVPIGLLLLGGAGITIGVATWGYKVMDTIGKKITHITPSRGFAAEFGAATTVLIFSMPFLAVPISTTHTLVGAVVGVGLAGGASAVDFRVFAKIAASWVASLPVAGVGAVVFYVLFGLNPTNVLFVSVISVGLVIYVMTRKVDQVEDTSDTIPIVVSEMPIGESTPGAARSVFELFYEHAVAVETTVDHMLEAVNAAVSGKDPEASIKATQDAELMADGIKADIRDMLGTGVRLAVNKSAFLHMLARQDRIADYAQNVAEQLSFRPLFDDEEARKHLLALAKVVSETVSKYEDTVKALQDFALSGFAKKKGKALRQLIRDVNLLEHKADEAEVTAASHVFSEGDGEPLAAMHMYRVLQRLDDVANACEKAANAFLPIVYD